MSKRCWSLLAAALLAALSSCTRGEPPSFAGDGAAAPLESVVWGSPAPRASATASASMSASAVASSSPNPSSSPSPSDAGVEAGRDDEQTRDRPSSKTPAFESRARALWDAIATDKPEIARPMFFPLAAYEKVKAVQNPAGDWRRRLVAAYERDIRDLHVQLGERASRAKFVALEVPDERGRWVEPGEEYNKLGYYRVFGARLKYEIGGRERSFMVKSLISWRGEWYVVHLSAMK